MWIFVDKSSKIMCYLSIRYLRYTCTRWHENYQQVVNINQICLSCFYKRFQTVVQNVQQLKKTLCILPLSIFTQTKAKICYKLLNRFFINEKEKNSFIYINCGTLSTFNSQHMVVIQWCNSINYNLIRKFIRCCTNSWWGLCR